MGFLTDPRYAQPVAADQVGAVARGMAAPMGLSNPGPLEPPHVADAAANVVGQYIQDHGNLLRQRLMIAHQLGGLAPAMQPSTPNLPAFLKNIPRMTLDPGFSNQGALEARMQHGARANLPRLLAGYAAQRYGGRH